MAYGSLHFTTFDGADYSFKALGEFVILRLSSSSGSNIFTLQGQTDRLSTDAKVPGMVRMAAFHQGIGKVRKGRRLITTHMLGRNGLCPSEVPFEDSEDPRDNIVSLFRLNGGAQRKQTGCRCWSMVSRSRSKLVKTIAHIRGPLGVLDLQI